MQRGWSADDRPLFEWFVCKIVQGASKDGLFLFFIKELQPFCCMIALIYRWVIREAVNSYLIS